MGDSRQLALQMQHAEAAGDRRAARALAEQILALPSDGPSDGDGPAEERAEPAELDADDPAAARRKATELLARTQPDAFLLVVGLLGLGLMVWLVYNYVL